MTDPSLIQLETDIRKHFGESGGLARVTEGYVPRESQIEMALDVGRTILEKGTFVAEAGTGTGKTFAYLAPALLSGKKVVVSTASKPLQDQLFLKDIPALKKALGIPFQASLLKGRANYLCRYRIDQCVRTNTVPEGRDVIDHFHAIQKHLEDTISGDRAEIKDVPQMSPIWPAVTSTVENCMKRQCPYFEECFVYKARAKAKIADVVVVNHHIFLASEAGDGGAEGRLLPSVDAVIFDEAHKLPEIATSFFGEEFSTKEMRQHLKALLAELLMRFKEDPAKKKEGQPIWNWQGRVSMIQNKIEDFVLTFEDLGILAGVSCNINEIADTTPLREQIKRICTLVTDLLSLSDSLVKAKGERKPENDPFEALMLASLALANDVGQLRDWLTVLGEPMDAQFDSIFDDLQEKACEWKEATADITDDIDSEVDSVLQSTESSALPDEEDDSDQLQVGYPIIYWVERRETDVTLHQTPLGVARQFSEMRQRHANSAWIFASATIATQGQNFSHFTRALGLKDARSHAWESPFNYPEQGMLYLPEGMPDPRDVYHRQEFSETLVEKAWPILDKLEGRTFFLCTSNSSMDYIAQALEARIQANGRPYTVLVQNQSSRAHLIKSFRENPHSILVATMSFWEGIDIKGDGLSFVVIDKLPFTRKDDPVLMARQEWLQKRNLNAFYILQLPMAIIALKQGVGRLLRSESDRGILMIGDNRINPQNARYASTILNSLPSFTRTMRLDRVLRFWDEPEHWT